MFKISLKVPETQNNSCFAVYGNASMTSQTFLNEVTLHSLYWCAVLQSRYSSSLSNVLFCLYATANSAAAQPNSQAANLVDGINLSTVDITSVPADVTTYRTERGKIVSRTHMG